MQSADQQQSNWLLNQQGNQLVKQQSNRLPTLVRFSPIPLNAFEIIDDGNAQTS